MLKVEDFRVGDRVHWPSYSQNMKGAVYQVTDKHILVDWDGWSGDRCSVPYTNSTTNQFIKIGSNRKPIIFIGE